jgi:hypothetical protein
MLVVMSYQKLKAKVKMLKHLAVSLKKLSLGTAIVLADSLAY